MKVKHAIALLERCNPESDLVIRDYSRVGIGPVPTLNVASITEGFDWEKGKTIIYQEVKGHIKDLLINKSIE